MPSGHPDRSRSRLGAQKQCISRNQVRIQNPICAIPSERRAQREQSTYRFLSPTGKSGSVRAIVSALSRPALGSSRSRTRGAEITALAISTTRVIPIGRLSACSSANATRLSRASILSTSSVSRCPMTSELAPAARRSTTACACTSPYNSVTDADVQSGSKTTQALERFSRVLGGHDFRP